ncbi:MAG: hypothetical protein V2J55_12020 [Candidatus Competibacteraceae bacterium]|jgi:hypothetical protein|nr:hypothetical protein [Candidatus Competibacteraceae bacterium]
MTASCINSDLEKQIVLRLSVQCRVIIEQVIVGVKRCHIVKDVFRNTTHGYADTVIELAFGLHNFRSYCRFQVY